MNWMAPPEIQRLRVAVRGVVQGVGFRPFVYRLATDLLLNGWVNNSGRGVTIEVEGDQSQLALFVQRLEAERPPIAIIQSLESTYLDAVGYTDFRIVESEGGGEKTTLILPDIATCPACLAELFDPANRRFRYPFTNCTHCGPRFSIVEGLPYDRPLTTMKGFTLCPACRAEYENPTDRRFHAQPNACPVCGPHLELWDKNGKSLAARDEALLAAAQAIRDGKIVALKGLGGFQLLVDARQEIAVQELRLRKRREEKPFAVMYPDLEAVEADCQLSAAESRLLRSPEAPIVLLKALPLPLDRGKGSGEGVAPGVAPGNPNLGVMLPYTPLHHLLMAELGFPIVATSGNLSDEPICTDEREAVERLRGIADLFLIHNRPIARQVDDSVARVMLERELILRRARGYAPLPITLRESLPPILAVGAHQKNAVALAVEDQVFISQHIGDLASEPAYAAFRAIVRDLPTLYERRLAAIACDRHPDYLSTQYAESTGLPVQRVQHHLAHVLSCMAENHLDGPVLGVSWDGTGYGDDGTIWGGEFFRVGSDGSHQRVASLRPFRLPGGTRAVQEPRRCAVGLLYEIYGDTLFTTDAPECARLRSVFSAAEWNTLRTMLAKGINCPVTTSVGRLFDGFAGLIGLRDIARFEGQAAMEVEFAAETGMSGTIPTIARTHSDGIITLDWQPFIQATLNDKLHGASVSDLSSRFHNWLVESIVAVATTVGETKVLLTGGCFQNGCLTERTVERLRTAGFRPYWHQRVPPNDGGIALGQIVAASRMLHLLSPEKGLDGSVTRKES